jgi:hypothetical protein
VLLVLLGGCRASRVSSPVAAVDFIKAFDRAEKRPAAGFSIGDYTAAGSVRTAIVAPVPSRLTWAMPIPRRGLFRAVIAAGAAPVRIRIGISDARIYEELTAVTLTAADGWTTVTADLSAYAGWKFSLFYRPDGRIWRLNLSADAIDDVPGRVAWGLPEIETSTADALEYEKRRLRITRSEGP